MKRLILMRHAKSDWNSEAGNDHARPLNTRGREAALALGGWLRAEGLIPDEVLCSTATRTRQTLAGLDLPEGTATRFEQDLYHAEAEVILTTLQGARGDVVLVLAHNPGIAEAAARFVTEDPDHAQFTAYPTGATLVADFDIGNWTDARVGEGVARHFMVPREL
jgi:phosphohistidine phosphatase